MQKVEESIGYEFKNKNILKKYEFPIISAKISTVFIIFCCIEREYILLFLLICFNFKINYDI